MLPVEVIRNETGFKMIRGSIVVVVRELIDRRMPRYYGRHPSGIYSVYYKNKKVASYRCGFESEVIEDFQRGVLAGVDVPSVMFPDLSLRFI